MQRDSLLAELDNVLMPKRFRDYAPNGLQIEGAPEITTIVTAVSASQAAINYAISTDAQALLVHHGYFWKGESPELTGIKRERIAKLLAANINLIAYHLPLDQHPILGNNLLLGECLEIENIHQSALDNMLWLGEVKTQSLAEWKAFVENKLQHNAFAVGNLEKTIKKVGWCTGAAQDLLSLAKIEGADVFISGEYAERSYHEANELDMAFFACGHHATERFGVRALGKYLQDEYGINNFFFDEDNPF